MALYKHSVYLQQSNDQAFDREYGPGNPAPFSGIYRCMGCGREVASNEHEPLPPQNHHQHQPATQGSVWWRMVVYAHHTPK